jgi:type VI protein secretion system component Hcp
MLTAITGIILSSSLSFGQNKQANPKGVTVTVSVDGLSCGAATQSTIDALTFQIAANDDIGSAGGVNIGRLTFSNLQIQRSPDSCSLPLFQLASSGKLIKQVVVTELDKGNKPVLTVTLANVLITTAEVKGADSAEVTEQVSFFYVTAVITDSAGNSTGTITRELPRPPGA